MHYKSWALNYLPGGLFVVRITSIGAWLCPWWDPWHWTVMCPDKDKKGWVLRSYDNNSCFDEKSVPHSIPAAPAASTEIWVPEWLSPYLWTQNHVCRPGLQVRCKVTPSMECFVVGNVGKCSLKSKAQASLVSQKYKQTSGCQCWCSLHSQKLHLKWFQSDVFVFCKKCEVVMTVRE